jgi:hypothetical protein
MNSFHVYNNFRAWMDSPEDERTWRCTEILINNNINCAHIVTLSQRKRTNEFRIKYDASNSKILVSHKRSLCWIHPPPPLPPLLEPESHHPLALGQHSSCKKHLPGNPKKNVAYDLKYQSRTLKKRWQLAQFGYNKNDPTGRRPKGK